WDGQRWSSTLSATPDAPPPPEMSQSPFAEQQQTQTKGSAGWILLAVAVLAVIVIAVLVIPRIAGPGLVGSDPLPPGRETSSPCPPAWTPDQAAPAHPNGGRLLAGPLSLPRLASPWGTPYGDERVPFGRDVIQQTVTIEENYSPGQSWVASILLAELRIGDGFYDPETGASIVAKCVTGAFYGDAVVTRDDQVNQAMTIDGHDAWILESQLSFDIDN